MSSFPCRSRQVAIKGWQWGFGFIELMAGLAVSAVLAVGAYQFLQQSATSSKELVEDVSTERDIHRFLAEITKELRNVVPMEGAQSAALGSYRPAACGGEFMASGIVPLPGYTTASFASETEMFAPTPSDPTLISGADQNSDALRLLIFDTTSVDAVTIAVDPNTSLPFPTSGTNPLVLSTTEDAFMPGDYVLVSDARGGDLARVTATSHDAENRLVLEHSTSTSIWNEVWPQNHGVTGANSLMAGGALVQKVNIVTYALDPAQRMIVRDDHQRDDGFDPSSQAFGGPAGLAHAWSAACRQADGLQFVFHVTKDEEPTEQSKTRTPRIAELGEMNQLVGVTTYCGNQLGKPYLREIEVVVQTQDELISASAQPSTTSTDGSLYGGPPDQPPVIIPWTTLYGTSTPGPTVPCLLPCSGGASF